MTINGIDVSSSQATFDFALAYAQGYRTAYIKLGGQNLQGNAPYVSSVYAARVDAAHAAGLIVGSYWVPGLHDPAGAANFVLANLHNFLPGDYVVLDNETLNFGNAYADTEAALFGKTIHNSIGGAWRRVKHYESESPLAAGAWPNLLATGCGFIVAWYGHSPLAFTNIGSIPADRIDGHQYADNGNVGGASPVDLNAFKDNAFDFSGATTDGDDAMVQNWNINNTIITIGETFVDVHTSVTNFYYLSCLAAYGPPIVKSMTADELTTIINATRARGAAYSAVGAGSSAPTDLSPVLAAIAAVPTAAANGAAARAAIVK